MNMIHMLFTARCYEPYTGKRHRRMAEEDDLFATRGSALASLCAPPAAAGRHTAKANAQQAAEQAALDHFADQAAADQAAADQAVSIQAVSIQAASDQAAEQVAADQAVAEQVAADQAAAEQVAADQATVVQAAADTQSVEAPRNNFQATAANPTAIQQLALGLGDDHQSTASQIAARSTADTAPRSPFEAVAMYSKAQTIKALQSTDTEHIYMLSGHIGLPDSTDLRPFPDSPLSTGQQHHTRSTDLSTWLGHKRTDSATKAGTAILAETCNEAAASAEQMECMVDRAVSARTASATALSATAVSTTAAETRSPADDDTAAPAVNLAGVAGRALTLSQSPQSTAQVRQISA